MHRARLRILGLVTLMSAAVMSSSAHATWLGLADGTYDVTLTCVISTVIPCPSTIQGTMTIAGAGASAFDFTVNGQHFIGDPSDGTATGSFGTDQFSTLDLSPFSFVSLQDFLSGNFPGLTQDSWAYCNNFDPTSCTPDTAGNWTATAAQTQAVPEPATITLVGFGLAALAWPLRGRRLARDQQRNSPPQEPARAV